MTRPFHLTDEEINHVKALRQLAAESQLMIALLAQRLLDEQVPEQIQATARLALAVAT